MLTQRYFQNQCYRVNQILLEKIKFLRVFEIKKKFYNLGFQNERNTKRNSTLSSCVLNTFNGYKVVQTEFGYKES